MDKLYLYFDVRKQPILTFSPFIINDIYEWCRALSISFLIDGYCFRPYNNTPREGEPAHMETWDKDRFTSIINETT